jgi:hypothetical protein
VANQKSHHMRANPSFPPKPVAATREADRLVELLERRAPDAEEAARLLSSFAWGKFIENRVESHRLTWRLFSECVPAFAPLGSSGFEPTPGFIALVDALKKDPDWTEDAKAFFMSSAHPPRGAFLTDAVLEVLGPTWREGRKALAERIVFFCIYQMDAAWQRVASKHGLFQGLDKAARLHAMREWLGDDSEFGMHKTETAAGWAASQENARQLFAKGFLDVGFAPTALDDALLNPDPGRNKGNTTQWASRVRSCLEALDERAVKHPRWPQWLSTLKAKPDDMPCWQETLAFAAALAERIDLREEVVGDRLKNGAKNELAAPKKMSRRSL